MSSKPMPPKLQALFTHRALLHVHHYLTGDEHLVNIEHFGLPDGADVFDLWTALEGLTQAHRALAEQHADLLVKHLGSARAAEGLVGAVVRHIEEALL